MFSRSKQQAQIQEQQRLLEQAKAYIQRLERERAAKEKSLQDWNGGQQFVLSQLEGAWEVPVRLAQTPVGSMVVSTVEPIMDQEGAEAAPPLLCFALQSAFAARARLEEISQSGWALVRAWPVNLPGGLDVLPGTHSEQYVVCALTRMQLWQQGQQDVSQELPARAKDPARFEFRA